jgi:hypothetical protein
MSSSTISPPERRVRRRWGYVDGKASARLNSGPARRSQRRAGPDPHDQLEVIMSASRLNSIISNPELRERLSRRFWAKVDCRGPDECWPWTAKAVVSNLKYGAINIGGNVVAGAHRVAFVLANGPIDGQDHIRHTCDNPKCCNPSHLLRGTPADNVRDMMDRGRHVRRPDTPEIRARIRAGRALNPPKQSEAVRLAKAAAMRERWQDPEWRSRQSESMTGASNPNYGKPFRHTEEARRKISEAGRARKVSNETKEKMRTAALEREALKRKARENP